MNLREIARALGGEISNGQVLAPGPAHSKNDRSLAVRLSPQSPDGFVVHSFAADDWRDCLDHVRSRLGLAAPSNFERREPHREKPKPAQDNATSRARAQALFAECVEPRGTVADYYLDRERGLPNALDDITAMTLRFHPRCPFKDGAELVRSPALVCALRDPREAMGACTALGDMGEIERRYLRDVSKVVAAQRIRLTLDGKKIERRSLGPMENSVVFIGSIWESFYGAETTIAEGVETALAMRALGFSGCVALAGAGRFRTFEPPFHWGEITIAAENDAGASENAWRDAGPRWGANGHVVRVIAPRDGKDANDVILQRAEKIA